jgi:hypothetical protein
VAYTKEQFTIDKRLLQLAENRLSARVAGHSGVELQQYRDEYFAIASKFDDPAMIHLVNAMFIDLMVREPLHGFDCMRYEKLLKVVRKKLGSLMFFRRKNKQNEVTCLLPLVHLQPCACKHLFDAKALEESAS